MCGYVWCRRGRVETFIQVEANLLEIHHVYETVTPGLNSETQSTCIKDDSKSLGVSKDGHNSSISIQKLNEF